MTALQKNADETEVKISQIMLPAMANSHGNVHGGEMLKLVDSIAYVCAARYCRGLCVTAAVDRVDFHQPIYVGELLSLTARIIYAGKTSMDVEIGVFAEDIPTGNVRHTNSCHLTLVHVVDGKPAPVPELVCRTREDQIRYAQARMRRQVITHQRQERDKLKQMFDSMTDDEINEWLQGDSSPSVQLHPPDATG